MHLKGKDSEIFGYFSNGLDVHNMAIGRCTAQDNQRLCEGCRDWNLLLDI
jgi:hypothetical protein